MSVVYTIIKLIFRLMSNLFFKDLSIIGLQNIPKEGPLILCGNHANQFIDAILLMAFAPRRTSIVMAASSFQKPVIGWFARHMGVIPVDRPQGEGTQFSLLKPGDTLKIKQFSDDFIVKKVTSDTEVEVSYAKPFEKLLVQSSYTVIPKLDQSTLYSKAWEALHKGACIAIFPEGGSHDRTEFLPLKAGVCIMSLGAMTTADITVKILPCGLNYYRGHEFRSKASIEFGQPYDIPKELAQRYTVSKKDAISELLATIEKNMRGVTIRAPTFSELTSVFIARSLYVPEDYKLSPKEEFMLNRRMAEGYNKFKDHPEVEKLVASVKAYRLQLKALGLGDGQLRTIIAKKESIVPKFFRSLVLFLGCLLIGLPGFFLNGPVGLFSSYLAEKERRKALRKSSVKVKATDVIASQKLVAAFVAFPVASFFYTFAFYTLIKYFFELNRRQSLTYTMIFFMSWPVYSYMMILCYDVLVRNLRRVVAWMYLMLYRNKLEDLLKMRALLKEKITEFVDKHGAEVVKDFDHNRIINKWSKKRKMQIELDKAFEILQELNI